MTKRGIPAITVCSTAFIVLGRKQLKALGCENHPIAIIPHPFGISTREQVKSIAEKCVDDIARIAIDPKAGTPTGAQAVRLPASAKADRIEVPEDSEEFDLFCIERRWSDGFPLRPPTLDRVERMIQASGREAHELIAIVQPGFGAATVEGIAINAVMAGCDPAISGVLRPEDTAAASDRATVAADGRAKAGQDGGDENVPLTTRLPGFAVESAQAACPCPTPRRPPRSRHKK